MARFCDLLFLMAYVSHQRLICFRIFHPQPRKYPKTPYSLYMENNRIHLYTVIQMGFFAALYMVKTIKPIAIAFPFFILLCIPARIYFLPRIFEPYELTVLDGSPEKVERFVERQLALTGGEAAIRLIEEDEDEDDDEDDDDAEEEEAEAEDDIVPVEEVEEVCMGVDEDVDEDELKENPGELVTIRKDVVNDEHGSTNEGDWTMDPAFTPEMMNAAVVRSGRRGRRKKTVSDVTGMFAKAHETNWSHV